MILEKAAYLLSEQMLTEAVCDKSIPNAVRWVTNWLARTGRGKDPTELTGQTTRFNNTQYYRDNPNAITQEQKNEIETQIRSENPDASDSEIRRLVNRKLADIPHNQSMAEDLVECIVAEFSHPIDYCRKGDYKMFIEGIARIAFTECDYGMTHENKERIKQLKKCYLAATMMYINSKNPNYTGRWKNSFNNSCDLDGMGFAALCRLCKPAYDELLEQWKASKTAYENERARKRAVSIIAQEEGINPADITEDQIIAKIEELNNTTNNIENIENIETNSNYDDVVIPEITTEGPYAGIPNPYMENAFRLGSYNCCLIPDYNASHTWLRFQNRNDKYPLTDNTDAPYEYGVGWCISYSSSHWNGYKRLHSNVTIYFCWKDNFRDLDKHKYDGALYKQGRTITADTEWGRSLLCIQVYDDGHGWRFGRATSRYNHADGYGNTETVEFGAERFGDDFVPINSEDGAKILATKYFGVSLDAFKNAFKVVRTDSESVHSNVNYNDVNSYKPLFASNNPENIRASIYVTIQDENEYRILRCGKPINEYWYKEIFNIESSKYVGVMFADTTFNILNVETGRHCFPDNFRSIDEYSIQDNYIKVDLPYGGENILNLETGRLLLKKPIRNIQFYNIKRNLIVCMDYTEHVQKCYNFTGKLVFSTSEKSYIDKYSKYFIITKQEKDPMEYTIYKLNKNTNSFELFVKTDKPNQYVSTERNMLTMSSDGKSIAYLMNKKITFYNYDSQRTIVSDLEPNKNKLHFLIYQKYSQLEEEFLVDNKYGYVIMEPFGFITYDLMTGAKTEHKPKLPDDYYNHMFKQIIIFEKSDIVAYSCSFNFNEQQRTYIFNVKTDKPIIETNLSSNMFKTLFKGEMLDCDIIDDNDQVQDGVNLIIDSKGKLKQIPKVTKWNNMKKKSVPSVAKFFGNRLVSVMSTYIEDIQDYPYGYDIYVDGDLIQEYNAINIDLDNKCECFDIFRLTDSLALICFSIAHTDKIFYLMVNPNNKEVLFTDIFKPRGFCSAKKPLPGAFPKIVKAPDPETMVGKLIGPNHGQEYYFNELGDCALEVESLEESLIRKHRNNNILSLYESAAYFC